MPRKHPFCLTLHYQFCPRSDRSRGRCLAGIRERNNGIALRLGPAQSIPWRGPFVRDEKGGSDRAAERQGVAPFLSAQRLRARHDLCIAVLLKAGADLDARDNKNRTALSLALERGNDSAAFALWSKGGETG